MFRFAATALVLTLVALFSGCASRPVNPPIAKADPHSGYRPYLLVPERENNDPHTLFVLSFSGGGTRAATFSYGVLEELRRTDITVDGQQRRLLDEVDIITGVSGGSFTALAYALYGDRLFTEYEQRFLRRDVQGTLIKRALNPLNWHKYIGGTAGRSELAAEYYDEILFEGATFGDLLDRHEVPVAVATGTDLSTGARLGFYQNDFDLLCSDLNQVRLSRAAATSSAVPVVLSPMTLNNYGGTCGYQYPAWVDAIKDPDARVRPSGRAVKRYQEMRSYQDSTERPYIHLVDGGVSDNIGVRAVLEAMEELAFSAEFRGEVGFGIIDHVVVIVVNSQSSPSTHWDRDESPPGFVSQLAQSAGVPIDHYSFDTVETMKDLVAIRQMKRDLKIADLRLAGMPAKQAEAAARDVDLTVVNISFEKVHDRQERQYLMNLPTSFVLNNEQVDHLRQAAGQLLRESTDYQSVVQRFDGLSTKAIARP